MRFLKYVTVATSFSTRQKQHFSYNKDENKSQFFNNNRYKNINLNGSYLTNLRIINFLSLQISSWSVVNCLFDKLFPHMNLSYILIPPFFLSHKVK